MAEFRVRSARPEDFTAIGDVTVEAYRLDGFFEVEAGYETVLRDVARRADHAELVVAVDSGGRVLGSVTVVRPGSEYAEISRPEELEFRMLAVAGEARGRGIGEALTRAVLDRGRELGAAKVVLSSHEQMRTAHRLYERIGFRRLPERDWHPQPDVTLIAYEYDL
ncbi:GNAT family N-acetyltransferase [Amycolatopsis ultiminotia]|uniref:GNAT family N-acetyltransferase n=1 Tax=Amycolatopsis ultiminotia TaxID=543629 RepID=A0ABP6Y2T7_9PSEU